MNCLMHPVRNCARYVSSIQEYAEDPKTGTRFSKNCALLSAYVIVSTVFPVFLAIELSFIQIPKLIISAVVLDSTKCNKTIEDIKKIFPAILVTLLTPLVFVPLFLADAPVDGITSDFEINDEDIQNFKMRLETWEKNQQAKTSENRAFAKERIFDAFINGYETLDLSYLKLTEIPKEVFELKKLKRLNLRNNQLRALPLGVSQLKDLKILTLNYNEISELPKDVLEAPSELNIYLDNNPIDERTYYEICVVLHRREDENLDCPTLHFNRSILLKYNPELQNLMYQFAKWEDLSSLPPLGFENIKKFKGEASQLSQFLERLTQTAEFQKSSKDFRVKTANILMTIFHEMVKNPALNTKALEEIHLAITSCHDRVSYGFDRLKLAYDIQVGIKNKSELEKAAFAIGLYRKGLIDEKASSFRDDPLETSLRLQIALKDFLKIPSTCQMMLFDRLSGLDDDDVIELGQQILFKTLDEQSVSKILSESPVWQEHLQEKDESFSDLALQVMSKKFDSIDIQKAEMRRLLDDKFFVDSTLWIEANYDNLLPLINSEFSF